MENNERQVLLAENLWWDEIDNDKDLKRVSKALLKLEMFEDYKALASTGLRKNALDILQSGIESVSPKTCMVQQVKYDGKKIQVGKKAIGISHGRLIVIGGGKAAAEMARVLETIIPPEKVTAGMVNTNETDIKTERIKIHGASHPLPDKKGVQGVLQMLEMTRNLKKEDIVICLLSGGGSALMPCLEKGITLEDMQQTTELLLKSGAITAEINTVRKHLSRIKGGKLARHLWPATVVSLIISDILDPNDEVASGPTKADTSTFEDSEAVLKRYEIWKKVPASVKKHIEKGLKKEMPETIKMDDPILKNVHNFILADYKAALKAMGEKAKELGFKAEIWGDPVIGEAQKIATENAEAFNKKQEEGKRTAILYAGETFVKVKGNGKGGRNQEYVAALMGRMEYMKNSIAASIGSDGTDFLKEIGGAFVDRQILKKAKEMDINEFLKDNNTYELHRKLGSLIRMQPTHTNVGDLHLFLYEGERQRNLFKKDSPPR